MSAPPSFEDLVAEPALPELRDRPSRVALFRFSAVTWNAHRIHYDTEWARKEGYPDVIVQSHLHGCLLVRAALSWLGPAARLVRFRWENRRFSVADEELVVTGRVVGTRVEAGRGLVDLELEEHTADGRLCTPGWATVALPLRAEG